MAGPREVQLATKPRVEGAYRTRQGCRELQKLAKGVREGCERFHSQLSWYMRHVNTEFHTVRNWHLQCFDVPCWQRKQEPLLGSSPNSKQHAAACRSGCQWESVGGGCSMLQHAAAWMNFLLPIMLVPCDTMHSPDAPDDTFLSSLRIFLRSCDCIHVKC